MRPIDADALLARAIKERRFVVATKDLINPEITIRTAYKDLYEFIKQAPTLTLDDLRPKGRWSIVEIDKVSNRITIECPECGMVEEMPLTAYGMGNNFCRNCGADMRGGGEEGDRGDL